MVDLLPGIRPGESTALYIENILTKLTTIGALYLTLVCLMPEFLIANYPIPFYLGGTSILIVVVVAIDTVTQIQTRLMSSQYEQLIKKLNLEDKSEYNPIWSSRSWKRYSSKIHLVKKLMVFKFQQVIC